MKTKLIQTEEYLLLIDEEAEIKDKEIVTDSYGNVRPFADLSFLGLGYDKTTIHKVIAYYPLTKEAKELDLPLLPPFEEKIDIEELFYNNCKNLYDSIEEQNISKLSFYKGYNAGQKSNKQFSLEDMKKAIEMAREYNFVQFTNGETEDKYTEEEIIQSLSTQEITMTFELNLNNNLDNYVYDIISDWRSLVFNPLTGEKKNL